MLTRLKIGTRIYLMGATQLVMMLIMGFVAISQMAKIGYELIDIAEEDIPLANFVTKITEHQLEQAIIFERALFHGALVYNGQEGAEQTLESLKQDWSALSRTIQKELVDTENFAQQGISKVHSEVAAEKFRQVFQSLKLIDEHYQHLIGESQLVLSSIGNVSLQELTEQAHHVEALEDALKDETVGLLDEIQTFTQAASLQAEKDEQQGMMFIIITLVIALAFDLIVPHIIGRTITRPHCEPV